MGLLFLDYLKSQEMGTSYFRYISVNLVTRILNPQSLLPIERRNWSIKQEKIQALLGNLDLNQDNQRHQHRLA
jgi:hypothetical protein